MHPCFKTPILFLTALISLNCLYAQESAMTISIGGDVKNPRQWTVEQLNAQFSGQIQEVKFRNIPYSVEEKTGNGIPLYSVIKAAEPWKKEETKWTQRDRADSTLHSEMAFIVILKARDSFHAVFSLAELMPEFGSTQVWLILIRMGNRFPELMRQYVLRFRIIRIQIGISSEFRVSPWWMAKNSRIS